ncbi:ABC transporter CDR4-like protein 4 [Botrytis cinerea]
MASASDHDHHDYFLERSENILDPQPQSISNHQQDVERPESSSSDDSLDPDTTLEPVLTNETAREPQFEPIRAGDREQLQKIASGFGVLSWGDPLPMQRLEHMSWRNKTPYFDVYKWAKMMMRLVDENGVIQRRAGIVFKNLKVCGSGSAINVQKNVGSLLMAPLRFKEFIGKGPEKTILNDFNGVLKSGEMLIVLGRPGITQKQMLKQFRGEIVYNQEVDKHFPHLTVGETLEFAASVRTPQQRLVEGTTRSAWAKHMTKVVMAIYGLSHTYNTKVGNDFVRGVSGGERKRVSIAEMALAGSPIASWDNATRGLDAATALEFTKSLRMTANLSGSCHLVAIYQASQQIYDQFDKAIVLYEGRQIYYGPCDQAKQYFEDMGWECPSRQTTGDFLTSITNPSERKARPGYENKVPRTPEEFEKYFKDSKIFQRMMSEMKSHEEEFPMGGKTLEQFKASRKGMQADHLRPESPYTVSIVMQTKLCARRAVQRLWNDKTSTITTIVGQIAMALIIGSIFYNTPSNTASFFQKGGVLFFAVLLNALIAISEINTLYSQRPIVEKQASYAFYHPFTEALAGVVVDIPMSQIYRSIAAATKTISQALAIAGVATLAIVIYTGFVIPRPLMHPWFKWISWINPVAYAFEALFVNELHGKEFVCSTLVPTGPGYVQAGNNFVCAVAGSVVGATTVSGDDYLQAQFQYSYSHIWRNLGFLFAFMIFFLAFYLLATEFNASTDSKAEVLVFRRGHVPTNLLAAEKAAKNDEEAHAGNGSAVKEGNSDKQGDEVQALALKRTFSHGKMLLDNVSGWVKPGTLTALMGVSGAGKTTLLDVLAQRVSMGRQTLDASFQRKTGYVQQQDLHLETTTVREALRFSAMLRQPKTVSKKEKYDFVEEVIKMLNMEEFSEAVVGVPGEGLNVEQRKLLTIGVELAAKPALLLFLDEPTSGLDSQSSWAIVSFFEKVSRQWSGGLGYYPST